MRCFKLVTFDVTNTILKFKKPVGVQYAEVAKAYGVSCRASDITRSFKHNWKHYNKRYPNFGKNCGFSWQLWWKNLVRDTFSTAGYKIQDDTLTAISSNLIQLYSSDASWDVAEGAKPVLKQLSQSDVTLGLISNFDSRLEGILREVGVRKYFDFIICSYETGFCKPDPRIFELALRKANCNSNVAVHIGDNVELDFHAARACGWTSYLLNHNKEVIPNLTMLKCLGCATLNLRRSISRYNYKSLSTLSARGVSQTIVTFISKKEANASAVCLPKSQQKLWMLGLLSFFGLFEKKKEDTELETLVKRGILAMREGDVNLAEQMFHVALKLAQDLEDDDAVTYIYDMMANLALENGQPMKAEKLFKDVLRRALIKGIPQQDNSVVHISLKLATVYAQMGDNQRANEGFKFCIDTQEQKLKEMVSVDTDSLALWAMSVDWYARFLIDQNKPDYAEKYFMKALDVCKTVNGYEHPQTAVLLSDLATVCALQKKHSDALPYLDEAIQIAKLLNLEELGAFHVNRGLIKLRMGLIAEAKKECKLGRKSGKRHDNQEIQNEAEECLNEIAKVEEKVKDSKPNR